ncbi:AraC family transcriptional regulator [Pontibacter sp. G13]|uniref:AraC family transcriptional regulator n=1 Tax=Pontibacter sp. G13 TaxID=3074898 RepID=UPI00288C13D4|nr:AraC family transcriptional regulator [Pontibacter sp. G13]WNJ20578.1 AraC family transcriptional regulator [Pontibacter sp. G13]
MKLVLKNTVGYVDERIQITKKEVPCLDSSWHYHAQYELLYVSKGSGIRFVGDSVSQFSPGDLVLVGPYLPHLWRNDPSYYQASGEKDVMAMVLKFTPHFIGEGTFELPEFSEVARLLEESKYGVCFGQGISERLHDELVGIAELPPPIKSIRLLDILARLSMTADKTVLSSTDMRQYTTENSQRIDTVLKFISDNYASYIGLQDVADVACMTTNSFCRFFKRMTNKSFTQFLNEVRIRNASRLLVQEDYSVSEVCYMVGYNSITNFNRQFKQIMGKTPNSYRQDL